MQCRKNKHLFELFPKKGLDFDKTMTVKNFFVPTARADGF